VSWMVKEIVLVRNEMGATKYHWLGRWALGEQGHNASKHGRQGQ
jgi:hypothetical protein